MKRKIEIVCWILFTICSGICFFVNFMSKPPVDWCATRQEDNEK